MRCATAAGATAPVLYVPGDAPFPRARPVAALACTGATYVPLEHRESGGTTTVDEEAPSRLGVVVDSPAEGEGLARWCTAVEAGRTVARDICGGSPERMGPRDVAELTRGVLEGSAVSVEVRL